MATSKQIANGSSAIQLTGEKQEIRAMIDTAIIARLDELRAPLSVPWVDVSRADVLRAVILIGLRCIDVEKTRAELLPMASGEERD